MTPLAAKFANVLTLPVSKRALRDDAELMKVIGGDLHCFEVTAIAKSIHDALEADNLWPDVESMLSRSFLPSPVTWLEYQMPNQPRVAWVLEDAGESMFRLSMAYGDKIGEPFSLPLGDFRARGILEQGERIEVIDRCSPHFEGKVGKREKFDPYTLGDLAETFVAPEQRIRLLQGRIGYHEQELNEVRGLIHRAESAIKLGDGSDIKRTIKLGIAFSVLALDLINTPGLVGLRQHDQHRGLARKLYAARTGSYPLRGWSEIVLKHQTRVAEEPEHHTGATFHKCLHFVRSHLRHYRDGKVTVIPAHWRGDPALGIKRTRYLVAA